MGGGYRPAQGLCGHGRGQKTTDLKIKIPDFALIRIIHVLVAASKSCAIGSHADGLPVDDTVEAGDHDCIILGP